MSCRSTDFVLTMPLCCWTKPFCQLRMLANLAFRSSQRVSILFKIRCSWQLQPVESLGLIRLFGGILAYGYAFSLIFVLILRLHLFDINCMQLRSFCVSYLDNPLTTSFLATSTNLSCAVNCLSRSFCLGGRYVAVDRKDQQQEVEEVEEELELEPEVEGPGVAEAEKAGKEEMAIVPLLRPTTWMLRWRITRRILPLALSWATAAYFKCTCG